MKQPTLLCSCIICKKQTSDLGITTHFMRSHGTLSQKQVFANSSIVNNLKKQKLIDQYNHSPTLCKECNTAIPYAGRTNTYCSHSCSAIVAMRIRAISNWTMPQSARDIISKKLSDPNNFKKAICGEYSKLFACSCKFCKVKWVSKNKLQVCANCQSLKWSNNKDQYDFKFNVFDYPELFDLDKLSLIGWVAFGGKRGCKKNPNGLSRDHRVSVNEAKQFGYDPYYISHPLNCELMLHIENNKKKTKSSITYLELVLIVDNYDKMGGLLRI